MARCLVVGGNGFLGSHVVDLLALEGHEVTAFDLFQAPAPNFLAPGVRRLTGDFLSVADLADALTDQEYAFHFVSTTTPASAEDDPSLDVRTNVDQSIRFFELAADAGVSCVYFASTGGAMYGNVLSERVDEATVPAPVSPYAIGKLAIEGYLRYFKRKRGLDSVSFRFSNPYGPRQHPNRKQGVIPIFLHRIAEGLPVEVFGDGSMVRDYLFAEDAARAVVSVVGRATKHEVYNVGSEEGTTINEIVAMAREVTGLKVEVHFLPKPTTFVDRVVLDTTRYTSEFGSWERVGLQEGVERTWQEIVGGRL